MSMMDAMLKSMGVDPTAIKKQVEDAALMLKHFDDQIKIILAKLSELETKLDCAMHNRLSSTSEVQPTVNGVEYHG